MRAARRLPGVPFINIAGQNVVAAVAHDHVTTIVAGRQRRRPM